MRSVEYRESEWDDEQRDLAMAYLRYVGDIGPHGHLMSEATDPGADPMDYENPLRFVAGEPVMDWAAKAKADGEAAWRAANGDDADASGWIFPVRKLGG